MPHAKPPVLGQPYLRAGDITTNTWVGARSARALESSLGYGTGRLSAGWWILLLTERLTAEDFTFSGVSLRSGGRLGLPTDDPETDKRRIHVQDEMIAAYGKGGVQEMKTRALKTAAYVGPSRLVKVLPVTPHSDGMSPRDQYPMGGGGLQWTLTRPCTFFVAVKVDENGVATTPTFSVFLGESAAYDDRAKLARYIAEA